MPTHLSPVPDSFASVSIEALAKLSEVHAGRGDAREDGDDHALLEVELGDGFLLLLLAELALLELAGEAHEDDAEQRDDDGDERDDRRRVLEEVGGVARHDRRNERARRGAESAADGEAESDAQVADHKPPREAAEPPQRAKADAPSQRLVLRVRDDVEELRTRREPEDEREDDEPRDRVDEPVRFVLHVLDAAERQREDGAGETAARAEKSSKCRVHREVERVEKV